MEYGFFKIYDCGQKINYYVIKGDYINLLKIL